MIKMGSKNDLMRLFDMLQTDGYEVIGPKVKDQAIQYEALDTFDDLAKGVREQSVAGSYNLKKTSNERFFEFTVGPGSLKPYLTPPRQKILDLRKKNGSISMMPLEQAEKKRAFFGIRSCDLSALAVTDEVHLKSGIVNKSYEMSRLSNVIIVAGCLKPGDLCFCLDMKTGPLPEKQAYDILILESELCDYHFISGSPYGEFLINDIGEETTENPYNEFAKKSHKGFKKSFPFKDVKTILDNNLENPHWDDVAQRCLSCANCTLVCPTCFCSTTTETSDISGDHAERWLEWDSCFNSDHSYIHGGSIRQSTKSKYRQWLVHKLSTWQDQFGMSGCVGCGRCIAWCPVGIDLTKEVEAIAKSKEV